MNIPLTRGRRWIAAIRDFLPAGPLALRRSASSALASHLKARGYRRFLVPGVAPGLREIFGRAAASREVMGRLFEGGVCCRMRMLLTRVTLNLNLEVVAMHGLSG